MYRAVASAFSAMPAARKPARTAIGPGAGSTVSAALAASPTSTTLLTVPNPGRCRSGTQASSTSAPTAITAQPNRMPSTRATPWFSTSQGDRPSLAWTISAMLTPNAARPR